MPIIITPAEKQEITKIICPDCKEKVRNVGLMKESHIKGLSFKCKRCGKLWVLKSE
jgi:transposase-like protein